MSDSLIRTATVADAERCLAVLTLAFGSDPPCRWAWPVPQQYLQGFLRFARAFGGGAIDLGIAHYYEGFSGVALWLPRVQGRMRDSLGWPCGSPRRTRSTRMSKGKKPSMSAISAVLPSLESAPLASEAISRLSHPVCSTPKALAEVLGATLLTRDTRISRAPGLAARIEVFY